MKLSRDIYVPADAKVVTNKPGFVSEYFVETKQIFFGIGNDETGTIILTKEAYKALKEGAEITWQ